jgi:hypothetical protein
MPSPPVPDSPSSKIFVFDLPRSIEGFLAAAPHPFARIPIGKRPQFVRQQLSQLLLEFLTGHRR